MLKNNIKVLLSVVLILIVSSGCAIAPATHNRSEGKTRPFKALQQLMEKENLTDARYQRIHGYDYFQVDLPLRYQLQHYQDHSKLESRKDFIIDVLHKSTTVGEDAMALYIPRLSRAQLNNFISEYPDLVSDASKLYESYRQHALKAEAEEIDRVSNINTVAGLDQYWQSFVGNIEESVMTRDRLKRKVETFPAVPFIEAWISYHEATDYRGPVKPDFKHFETYTLSQDAGKPDDFMADNWRLLQHFAPVIVHEVNPDASYSIENDRLGEVYLTGKDYHDIKPGVDTKKPAVYAYIDHKKIQGVIVKQLVYTFFHPSHPKLSELDPEAGPFDGWTIRITLDQNNQPLDFESVSDCGCYYKNFPTNRLELLASEAFPKKLQDKKFFVENSVAGKYDAVVPELVTGINTNLANDIVVYYSAGHHQLITIRSKQHAELLNQASTQYKYQLHHYSELENLPFDGRHASLFGPDGLVRGAYRLECTLLKPSGLYNAGQPRQRETQMIYFDEAQFDDPGLLATYLRLPPNAFGIKK